MGSRRRQLRPDGGIALPARGIGRHGDIDRGRGLAIRREVDRRRRDRGPPAQVVGGMPVERLEPPLVDLRSRRVQLDGQAVRAGVRHLDAPVDRGPGRELIHDVHARPWVIAPVDRCIEEANPHVVRGGLGDRRVRGDKAAQHRHGHPSHQPFRPPTHRASLTWSSTDQRTECMIVPVYVPATCEPNSVIATVGFQDVELLPTPAHVPATPGAMSDVAPTGTNAPVPVELPTPVVYATLALATVSLAVAVPVVKSVDDTLADHCATSAARVSFTVVDPSVPDTRVLPVEKLPRLALEGTLMASVPLVRSNVVLVSPGPAQAAAPVPKST